MFSFITVANVAIKAVLFAAALTYALTVSVRWSDIPSLARFQGQSVRKWRSVLHQRLYIWQSLEIVGKLYLLSALFIQFASINPNSLFLKAVTGDIEFARQKDQQLFDETREIQTGIDILEIKSRQIEIRREIVALRSDLIPASAINGNTDFTDADSAIEQQILEARAELVSIEDTRKDYKEWSQRRYDLFFEILSWDRHAPLWFAMLGISGTLFLLVARFMEMKKKNGSYVVEHQFISSSRAPSKSLQKLHEIQRGKLRSRKGMRATKNDVDID
ncbi:MAG: hypothetical protein KJ871_00330 [Alphaproteobacteria bacterium]|nr:hypothetical protein [Alphaproteobacteria bacterium]MBU2083761.1 hypothetical protein [Alphaproteobacteria bacterium]MBU2142547.1 hypothetical protein [Alphaproteobacteria bacterium]MBU2197700.1 hypothetical protein [Alphaproteobacteria bacterium]